jgi:hypothetical protein
MATPVPIYDMDVIQGEPISIYIDLYKDDGSADDGADYSGFAAQIRDSSYPGSALIIDLAVSVSTVSPLTVHITATDAQTALLLSSGKAWDLFSYSLTGSPKMRVRGMVNLVSRVTQ